MAISLRQIAMMIGGFLLPITGFAEAPPKRVVSLNVCTDQLAMMLAQPGQLQSISFLATDPKSSLLYEAARAYPINHGTAEEVFLLKPDLILAGSFSTRTTVQLLKRLGFRVEEFAPENSIDEIKQNILRIGALLGSDEKARTMVSDMDERLKRITSHINQPVAAAFYYSNSYTAGKGTLISDIARLAGVKNIADDLGIIGMGNLPLEQLLLSRPQLIVANETKESSPALAQQNYQHPAFRAVLNKTKHLEIDGRLTSCGLPDTITAIEELHHAASTSPGPQ